MTEFPRSFFKTDPIMGKIYQMIKAKHVPADHTAKTLYENKHIKDFCESARHFVDMGRGLYIHYDVDSWYDPKGALVKITSIGVYESFMEYETARMRGLHSGRKSDIPNIN